MVPTQGRIINLSSIKVQQIWSGIMWSITVVNGFSYFNAGVFDAGVLPLSAASSSFNFSSFFTFSTSFGHKKLGWLVEERSRAHILSVITTLFCRSVMRCMGKNYESIFWCCTEHAKYSFKAHSISKNHFELPNNKIQIKISKVINQEYSHNDWITVRKKNEQNEGRSDPHK